MYDWSVDAEGSIRRDINSEIFSMFETNKRMVCDKTGRMESWKSDFETWLLLEW